MVLGLCTYKLLKHNHLRLQLRISNQWFTRKTLLNTHLNFMGNTILLGNPTSLTNFARQMKIYLYTPIPVFATMMWPFCLHQNST